MADQMILYSIVISIMMTLNAYTAPDFTHLACAFFLLVQNTCPDGSFSPVENPSTCYY